MNIRTQITTRTLTTVKYKLCSWEAQEKLKRLLKKTYPGAEMENDYEVIQIAYKGDIDPFQLEWLIEQADAFGKVKLDEWKVDSDRMDRQKVALEALIQEMGEAYHMYWSVSDVESIDDIAHDGEVTFHYDRYQGGVHYSPKMTNPTWREVAIEFNRALVADGGGGDHVFLEGIGVKDGVGTFHTGS